MLIHEGVRLPVIHAEHNKAEWLKFQHLKRKLLLRRSPRRFTVATGLPVATPGIRLGTCWNYRFTEVLDEER